MSAESSKDSQQQTVGTHKRTQIQNTVTHIQQKVILDEKKEQEKP